MEQFDSEYQPAIDAARAAGADAEALADAGHFDRKGWNWPLYWPLVQFALDRGWPLAAANLSRAEARAIVADPARSGLPPAPAVTKALERDIIDGHCGAAPEPKRLAGMVEAQRARDVRMASVLKGPNVLIAGKVEHFHRKQLERAQEFGAAGEQERSVWAGEFDQDFRPLPITIIGHGRIDSDAVLEFQSCVPDERTEKCIELICGFEFVHNGSF